MFPKITTVAAVALIFSAQMFSAQVNAHAAIAPALGVRGDPMRADVQSPSAVKPCGEVDIATNINNATSVVTQADGSFVVTVTDFNPGADGSRSVSLVVDTAGTGKNFVPGTVTKNGVAAPKTVGSDQVTAVLSPGTKCTGGASQNLCLASFKTTAGFGNCVVVQQSTATATTTVASAVAACPSSAVPVSSVATTTAVGNSIVVAAEAPPRHHLRQQQAGTRTARALRAGFEVGEQSAKRTAFNWIWA